MPDLVTHTAAIWTVAWPWRRREAARFALLGAVVPDLGPAIYIPLLDLLGWPRLPRDFQTVVWYFLPWHTPWFSLLVCGVAVCLFAERVREAFLWSAAGVVSHFALDALQRHIGLSLLVAYPFVFRGWERGLWFSDHPVFVVLSLVSLAALPLLWGGWTARRDGLKPKPGRWRRIVAAALGATALLVPLATREALYRNDFHSLGFFRDPSSREGGRLAICVAEVVSVDPWVVRELGRSVRFVPPSGMEVRVGDRVSFEGVYRDGMVAVERWHVHRGAMRKMVFSLVGLAVALAALALPAGRTGEDIVPRR